MVGESETPRWPGLVKWGVVLLVLAAVIQVACDGACCDAVALATAEGAAFGAVFGLLGWESRLAAARHPRRFLTPRRLWAEVRREAGAAAVVGLLAGVTKALVAAGG